MNVKLDYNQIIIDASNRLHAIINACINKDNDSIICNTCSSMYSCEKYIPVVKEIVIPVPQRQVKKRKLFTFLDEEVEHGQ